MKYLFLTLIVGILSVPSIAQDIDFFEESFQFGSVKELEGPVEHKFLFTNSGSAPLVVKDVKPSCGCTTTGFTRDSIMPGDTGFVKASFNPINRPGKFTKSLSVYTNSQDVPNILTFSGFVVAKQKTLQDEYPVKIGHLRFNDSVVNIGRIVVGDTVRKNLNLYNDSENFLKIKKHHSPSNIALEFPDTIEGQKMVVVSLIYSSSQPHTYGPVKSEITFVTNDSDQPKKTLSVVAEIVDSTFLVNDDSKRKYQDLDLKEIRIDFDSLTIGSSAEKLIEIKNSGKEDLLIRRVVTNSRNIDVEIDKQQIKPGGKAKLKVVYKSKDILGRDAKAITIYSNDPATPVIKIPVTAYVVKKEVTNKETSKK